MEILGVFVVIIALVFGYGFLQLGRFNSLLRMILGIAYRTDSLATGMDALNQDLKNQPKSVSAMTSLYLPQIMRDFPEFHYEEMKARAQNVLITYLRSVDNNDAAILSEGMPALVEQLKQYIQMQRDRDEDEHFQSVQIHRMEISEYRKQKGRSTIVFQAAVEYFHYVEQSGQIISGRKDYKEQGKFEVEVCYIQDAEVLDNHDAAGFALNCPNCGAPLKEVGMKTCYYCGSPVIELNVRMWNFSRVEKIK